MARDHAHDDGAHLLTEDVARIGAADAGPVVLELPHEVVAVLLDEARCVERRASLAIRAVTRDADREQFLAVCNVAGLESRSGLWMEGRAIGREVFEPRRVGPRREQHGAHLSAVRVLRGRRACSLMKVLELASEVPLREPADARRAELWDAFALRAVAGDARGHGP